MKNNKLISLFAALLLVVGCSTKNNDENSKSSSNSNSSLISNINTSSSSQKNYLDGERVLYDGIYYRYNNNQFSVVGYDGDIINVSLKSHIDNYPVTAIGAYAFSYCSTIESVIVPEGIKDIQIDAFFNCQNLVNIELPESMMSIHINSFSRCYNLKYNVYENGNYLGNKDNPYLVLVCAINYDLNTFSINDKTKIIMEQALARCTNLENIFIPKSVLNIGNGTFYDCPNLSNIEVEETNASYKSVDGNLYSKDGKEFIQYATGKEDSDFIVPKGVTQINDSAFAYCESLKNVLIMDGVEIIGMGAFSNCTNLEDISLPNTLMSIDSNAFYRCNNLKYQEYENGRYLGNEGNLHMVLINIIDNDFETFTINSSTRIIVGHLFSYSDKLTNIFIPESVENIGSKAFSSCPNLLDIEVEETNKCYKSIDGNLYSKDGKELIQYAIGKEDSYFVVPNEVRKILTNAFASCENLNSILLHLNIVNIEDYAFEGCQYLIIYSELNQKPQGWGNNWNPLNRPVYWVEQWKYINGVPTPIS